MGVGRLPAANARSGSAGDEQRRKAGSDRESLKSGARLHCQPPWVYDSPNDLDGHQLLNQLAVHDAHHVAT
jgi:hypothetical protein